MSCRTPGKRWRVNNACPQLCCFLEFTTFGPARASCSSLLKYAPAPRLSFPPLLAKEGKEHGADTLGKVLREPGLLRAGRKEAVEMVAVCAAGGVGVARPTSWMVSNELLRTLLKK